MEYEVTSIISYLVNADSKEEALERFTKMELEYINIQDDRIEIN
jgi:hypothetical protein